MGMGGGGGTGHAVSEINVTPLIDVLLVLLIIFMVIVPVTPKGLDALVPQPPKPNAPQNVDDSKTIVVQILGSAGQQPTFKINDETYAKQDIAGRLLQIFQVRPNKVMFVKGDPDVDYGQVAAMIDAGHQAGVENIGIITPKVEAGQ
jgi:biopolymer transport protein TolR